MEGLWYATGGIKPGLRPISTLQMNGKKNSRKQQQPPKRRPPPRPSARTTYATLDAGAIAYRTLLEDPCNAALTYPSYGGSANGYLLRTRQLAYIAPTNQDFVFEFNPTRLPVPGLVCGATATGTTLGPVVMSLEAPQIFRSTIVNGYRAIAGCVKVIYSGAELSRQGLISASEYEGIRLPSVGTGGSGPTTAAGYGNSSLITKRLGEPFEVRWLPSGSDQIRWSQYSGSADVMDYSYQGTSIMISGQNITPGAVTIEVTFVWEWVPDPTEPIVGNIQGITSTTPFNTVLRSLGNLGLWAMNGAAWYAAYRTGGASARIGAALSGYNAISPPGPGLLRLGMGAKSIGG